MGSHIELNDTLQITTRQGFPVRLLNLQKHRKKQLKAEDFAGRTFTFRGKLGARIYHPAPNRCFLVHNINGKWIYWGKIEMVKQTIESRRKGGRHIQTTSGEFRITRIYEPEYQRHITRNESPKGKSYL